MYLLHSRCSTNACFLISLLPLLKHRMKGAVDLARWIYPQKIDLSRTESPQHSQRAVSELSRDFKAGLSLSTACVPPWWYTAHYTTATSKGTGLSHHSSQFSNGRAKLLGPRHWPRGVQSPLIWSIWIPSRFGKRKSKIANIPGHIVVKLLNYKHEKKNFHASRQKK